MRRPVNDHHTEAGNDLPGIFQHPAKIAAVGEARDQPSPEGRGHLLQAFAGAAGLPVWWNVRSSLVLPANGNSPHTSEYATTARL